MKSKSTKIIVSTVFLVAVFLSYFIIEDQLNDGFKVKHLIYKNIDHTNFRQYPFDSERQQIVQTVLSKPFHYLGKGAQCYAFTSEDGHYVIKIFKFKFMKPNPYLKFFPNIPPFSWLKMQSFQHRQERVRVLFASNDVAFRELQDEAKIVYAHLAPSEELSNNTIQIFDKLGYAHTLNANSVFFVIQQKGETLQTRVERLIAQNHTDQLPLLLEAIIDMYLKNYAKGYYDRDYGIIHNTGFIGNTPFNLDVGQITKDERLKDPKNYKKDLLLVFWKLHFHFMKAYPNYHEEFCSHLNLLYKKVTGDSTQLHSISREDFETLKSYL